MDRLRRPRPRVAGQESNVLARLLWVAPWRGRCCRGRGRRSPAPRRRRQCCPPDACSAQLDARRRTAMSAMHTADRCNTRDASRSPDKSSNQSPVPPAARATFEHESYFSSSILLRLPNDGQSSLLGLHGPFAATAELRGVSPTRLTSASSCGAAIPETSALH